jgi:hypothetical protein
MIDGKDFFRFRIEVMCGIYFTSGAQNDLEGII